jgi:hypothetical protein
MRERNYMRRNRHLKELKRDRPPFRRLTAQELTRLLNAGGMHLEDPGQFGQLESAIDDLRGRFLADNDLRKLTLTDKELDRRLRAVRETAVRLQAMLYDRALALQTVLLAGDPRKPANLQNYKGQFSPKDRPKYRQLDEIIEEVDRRLEDLKWRRAHWPNDGSLPAAAQPGLDHLAVGLGRVWIMGTRDENLSSSRGSPFIFFLQEGLHLLAQRDVTEDAARKWAHYVVHALSA